MDDLREKEKDPLWVEVEILTGTKFLCQENHPLTYSDEAIPDEYIWKVEMTPKLGQLVSMESQNVFEKWWKDLIDK